MASALPEYYESAVDEYQNATDMYAEAIRDGVSPAKLATCLYRYAMAGMSLGQCKLLLDLGQPGAAQDAGRRAKKDFVEVQRRIALLR
jgi:hypothetical protein